MANSRLSKPNVILLAVQSSIECDLSCIRALVSRYPETLSTDILLRILLTYLPESLESSEYLPLLLDLSSGQIHEEENCEIDDSLGFDDAVASQKVKKLHLLPLLWPSAPENAPDDPLIRFLIHRSYRIDHETGLIAQVRDLIIPFLSLSEYLRRWMVSIVLPLLRFNLEYYPLEKEGLAQTLEAFESLDGSAGVRLLLSRTGMEQDDLEDDAGATGRDLRGLIGPWLSGQTQWKHRMLQPAFPTKIAQVMPHTNDALTPNDDQYSDWEEVFKWITSQAADSWLVCVHAIEQWDGPGDMDLGGYGNEMFSLEERFQQHLERRYARAMLTTAYLISEASVDALNGVHRILMRVIALFDLDHVPTLSAAAALLSPVPEIYDSDIVSSTNATSLRTDLMNETNQITTPNPLSVVFLYNLLISAFLLTRAGLPCSVRRAGELVLLRDEKEQAQVFQELMQKFANGPKGDDKYWIRTRNELLWLRDWGRDHVDGSTEKAWDCGIFSRIEKEFLETEILKTMLANTRYTLARSIYETNSSPPISTQRLQQTVVSAAMTAYDNATNANRTRGGVKKCDDIIRTFEATLKKSPAYGKISHLLSLTHSIGEYRLILKRGEVFAPVNIRTINDPISIIEKVIEQNDTAYTNINNLVQIGEQMVLAGLITGDVDGNGVPEPEAQAEALSMVRERITSICIAGALAQDDFETAYSYVMTRLPSVAPEAESRIPYQTTNNAEISAKTTPRILDDWSWKAALEAGKYRLNKRSVQPTHLGNASGNPEIRHLEQRLECLSQALRIAPPATLKEILQVYRRCEEELDTKIQEEAQRESDWDNAGDEKAMPGGFGEDPRITLSRPGATIGTAASRTGDEAPMSLLDLARESSKHARQTFSTFHIYE